MPSIMVRKIRVNTVLSVQPVINAPIKPKNIKVAFFCLPSQKNKPVVVIILSVTNMMARAASGAVACVISAITSDLEPVGERRNFLIIEPNTPEIPIHAAADLSAA